MTEQKNDLNFFKKIAGTFIHNKELGVLIIIFIVFFGVLGFVLMPKQYNPEIVAPAFRINTQFPHATAEEVYELVTRPLENKVREMSAVDEIYSQSMTGYSSVLVTFDVGSSEEDAKINLVQRLRSNMDEKPIGAEDPLIMEIDTDDVPIVTLAITGEKYSPEALRSFALDLTDRIKHVPDTASMIVRGGRRADLSVFIDSDKLHAFDISIVDVERAISQNNAHTFSTHTDSDPYNITVRAFGNIADVEDLNKIVVAYTENGTVRVEDIAEVVVGEIRIDNYVRLDDHDSSQDAVYVGIAKQNGANATTVSKDIHNEIAQLKNQGFIPDNITVRVMRDDGAVASNSISALTKNLITSIVIVIMVLLFFLNTRSALVVAIAIPLSLLSVFGLGLLFGETINRITLFALILSLGLLVDNATVVVENMYRHLQQRKNDNRDDVIIDAVAEVGGGLVMSTITTVLAFIPMAFVTGMMGPYMGPIPFFVPAAILASLFIALTISPFMGSIFLHAENGKTGIIARMQKMIARGVVHIENTYVHFLKNIFSHNKKSTTLLVSVALLLLISISLPIFTAVKFRMLPKADRNQFYVYLDANTNTHIEKTDDIARQATDIIIAEDDVVSVQSTVGTPPIVDFNGLFKGSDDRALTHLATLKVNLSDKDVRQQTSEDIAQKTRALLTNLAHTEDVNVKIIEDPPGPPVLATYHIKVQGEDRADYSALRVIAEDLSRVSHDIAGVVDVDTTQNEDGVEKSYRINTEEATRLGVNVDDIFTTLGVLSYGNNVGLFHDTLTNDQKFSEQHYISVRSNSDDRATLQDMERVSVRSTNGALVALPALLEEITMPIDDTILMDNQYPTVYVSGEMEGRSVVYASIDMLTYLVKEYHLPSGAGVVDSWNLFGVNYVDSDGTRYNVRIGGEWQLTLEVFRDFGIAFAVAIFLIYFVLVAQFRSLKVPLYIMATIPLSLIGVMPGFMFLYIIKGTYFNATSMIGVIALSGIVVNNAIIYLEYVFQERAKGIDIDQSLIDAGRTRLLPIVLTSLTTILGSMTIVSDPVWEGLAWAIITGLSLSAFLTLVVLPVLYRRFEK